MTTTNLTRRHIMAGAAALAAAAPAAASALPAVTPIGELWTKAEALRLKLEAHRAAIAAAAHNGGISGWMRLGGEANALGEARYQALIAILKSKPHSATDLAIMGKTVLDDEIGNAAQQWASAQFANATIAFHRAA
jgi:hypothetical protein